ncbi:MAG: hypothetical protein GY765_35505 [bacterium]|nr:hypothetical protein [bacterium]
MFSYRYNSYAIASHRLTIDLKTVTIIVEAGKCLQNRRDSFAGTFAAMEKIL